MGRVMLECAPGRRSVRTVFAAGLIPATLLLFGLGDSGTPPPAAIESAKQGPRQEERPLTRSGHGAAVVNGRIYVIGGAGEDHKPFGSVQVYDPATGTWAARANMPTSRGLLISSRPQSWSAVESVADALEDEADRLGYSWRRARTGSTRNARRAGIALAASAISTAQPAAAA